MFGLAFVVSLNVAARWDQPRDAAAGLDDVEIRSNVAPGGALAPRPPALTAALIARQAEQQVYERNLNHLRRWSLGAVIGLVATSGIGGYVVSGFLLRPVREITRVASEIGASNLNRRINHQGVDDELKGLADTFDSMIDRLQRAFDAQQRFVQDASHELRTPLAAIRTNIEVLEMDASATPEDYLQLIDLVRLQTERLSRLAEDLLLLTSPAEQPELEEVDLERLAREVARNLAGVATLRSVNIRLDLHPHLAATANPNDLFRCVSNLVDNAIKYSGDGAQVTISTGRDGGDAVLRVADNGPGIPPDALPHIFERFYRVDTGRSRRQGGSGLGLAIARELVGQMGGTVSVTSAVGAGSAFTIRLPAARPEPDGRWRRRAAPPAGTVEAAYPQA